LVAALALVAACEAQELPTGAVARLGTERFRHGHTVSALDWSRDGRWVASASWDGTSRVWDAKSGREVAQIKLPEAGSAVAVAPDGSLVAAGYMKRGVIVWDPKTGKEIRRIEGNENTPFYLTWSPDGRRLTWVAGKTIRVWDALNWKEERTIRPLLVKDDIRPAAISADVKWAATVRDDKVDLWSLDSGQRVKTIEAHGSAVRSVGFSDDTALLATTAQDGMLRVIDLQRGAAMRAIAAAMGEDPGWRLRFIDKGRRIVSGGHDGVLRVWDVGKGAASVEVRVSGRSDLWTMAMALSPDGKMLATCGTEKAIRMWDLSGDGLGRLDFAHSEAINSAVFLAEGNTIATASDDGLVLLWDAASGKRTGRLEGTGRSDLQIAADRTGRALAVSNEDPGLAIFDGATFRKRATVTDRLVAMHNVAMSADGSTVAAAERHDTVRVIDVARGEERCRFKVHARQYAPIPLAFSPDGALIAAGSGNPDDKWVTLFDTRTGQAMTRLDVLAGELNGGQHAIAWSGDGTMIAVASLRKPIEVWEVLTGKRRARIEGDGDAGTCVALSNDGRYVAAGGGPDRPTVRVWDLMSGRMVAKFAGGHKDWLTMVAFSPDGRRVVSASRDTTAVVWDVEGAVKRLPAAESGAVADADALWTAMGNEDAREAWRAMQGWWTSPERAIAYIGARLASVPNVDEENVRRLVDRLDADAYSERMTAQREIIGLGDAAMPVLRRLMARDKREEVRTRLGVILVELGTPAKSAELVRELRGVEVLGRIGSAAACEALERVAKARAGSLVGERAAEAVKRTNAR
jgi:WD40 repeat protein